MKKRRNAVLIAAIVFFIAVALLALSAWATAGFTVGNVTKWFNGWGHGIQPAPASAVYAPVTHISSYAAFTDFGNTESIELKYTYGEGDTYGKFIGYRLSIEIDEAFSGEFQARLPFEVDFKTYSATDNQVELEAVKVENADKRYCVSAPAHRLLLSDFIVGYDGLSESCKSAVKKTWYEVYGNYSDKNNAAYDVDFYYRDLNGNLLAQVSEADKPCYITGNVYSPNL